ncbi:MAG: helix-turn-helix transcriptional regulator [bacterium]|nr:helix-turn-helix transcriptional regulator [bacterium]
MKCLFSPTTDRVLAVFLRYPETRFYANQIVQLTDKYPNSITQSLKRLEKMELLNKTKVGKYFFYSLNKKHPLLSDIASIMYKLGVLPQPLWISVFQRIFASFPDQQTKPKTNSFQVCVNNFKLTFVVDSQDSGKISGLFRVEEKSSKFKVQS